MHKKEKKYVFELRKKKKNKIKKKNHFKLTCEMNSAVFLKKHELSHSFDSFVGFIFTVVVVGGTLVR